MNEISISTTPPITRPVTAQQEEYLDKIGAPPAADPKPEAPKPARTRHTVAAPVMPNKAEKEATQRLGLDIPVSLHDIMKKSALERKSTMKDDVMVLLKWHYLGER